MTHKHNLDRFTPWKIESYELHDTYVHGEPPPDADEMPIAVGQYHADLTRSSSRERSTWAATPDS